MKKLNMFTRLPKEEQTLVLNLCATLPYHEAVEQLARPREEGGLAMTTSESSLCKFYTRHNPESAAIQAACQYAAAVQVQQQAHGAANFEAILALVQNRILESLRAGKSLSDLDKDFRSLQRVQKCFLDDVKYRHRNDHVTDAYLEHVKDVARADGEPEFIRNDVENDPGAGYTTIDDFQAELSQYELDLEAAGNLPAGDITPTSTFLRRAARIVAALKLSDAQSRYIALATGQPALTPAQHEAISSASPAQLVGLMKANAAGVSTADRWGEAPAEPGTPSEISDSDTSKSPAISHISPNFASPVTQPAAEPRP